MNRHIFKISLGIILVIIGLIGSLIPIFQGWIFGIPGLIILANYFPPIKRLLFTKYDHRLSRGALCPYKAEVTSSSLVAPTEEIYHFPLTEASRLST